MHCTTDSEGCWAVNKAVGVIVRAASAPDPLQFCKADTFESDSPKRHPCDDKSTQLSVVNWNIAAPNNNPFEYWAGHDDQCYNQLMAAVQGCIDNPSKWELEIGEIFTHAMFAELHDELAKQGVPGLPHLEQFWTTNLKSRKSITEFLKDTAFGDKRLISMPDRVTGCIDDEHGRCIFRPSPITGFQEDMQDIATWWSLWKQFMFHTSLNGQGRIVFSMLEPIPRAKYPALSEAEEAMSVPLQVLCLALFDAIFTHLLSSVAPETWQPLKRSLHRALCANKSFSCVSILQGSYSEADVVFVQEASESFALHASRCLNHVVLRPPGNNSRRSQMSLILAKRSTFIETSARDLTEEVAARLKVRCIEPGDLCVYEIFSGEGPFLLASFHGDSNGKSTLPVLAAVEGLAQDRYPRHTLIFGLDGNTVSGVATAGSPLSVDGFSSLLSERGVASCWGGQDLEDVWTTFNARTYLQPQLQKAVGLSEVLDRRHMQLKDWILFYDAQLAADAVERDNTGRRKFLRAVIPSRAFPSDHAIVAVTLHKQ